MCFPVYCLTPPFLLTHYCFSYATWCLQSCAVSLFNVRCFTSCVCARVSVRVCVRVSEMFACTAVLCLPVFPLGWFLLIFVAFYYKKKTLSPALESTPYLSSGTMTERNSQMKTHRRMGSHHPPASKVSSPLYQRIHQFQALSSLRQQGTDVKKFALRTSVVQQRGWGTMMRLSRTSSIVPLMSPSTGGG